MSGEDRREYYRQRYRGERHEHHKIVRRDYYRRNRDAILVKRRIYWQEHRAAIKVAKYWNVRIAEARRMLEQGSLPP